MDNLSPEQIKQMISMLQSMLPTETSKTEDDKQSIQQETSFENIKPVKTKSKKQLVNKFDQMQESRLHKEDIAIDKALSVYAPTPRTRSFDPVEAVCRVCGKKEQVNPSILYDSANRFKCNNCSRSPG